MGTSHKVTPRETLLEKPSAAGPSRVTMPRVEPRDEIFLDTSHSRIALRQSEGPGLPLLLLHGGSSGKEVFAAQFASPLAYAHRLIAIDLPGHGASGDAFDPSATYSIPGYADAAVEVLERLGIDQVAVLGWALGGHVALEMAASFPGVVGAFVTGAPPLECRPEALGRGFRIDPLDAITDTHGLTQAEIAAFDLAAGPGADATSMWRANTEARAYLCGSLLAGDYEDARRLVESSEIPVAMVVGADDPLVDTAYLRGLAYASLWSGACHLVPHAGHAPFLGAARIFNHLLAAFVRDMDVRARALRETPQLVFGG